MFTVGSSTSATFVLPVRHGTGVALQRKRVEVSLLAGFDVAIRDPLGRILCVRRIKHILDSGLVRQLANPLPVLQCILSTFLILVLYANLPIHCLFFNAS